MKLNQDRLEKYFMTKVGILPKGKKGKIEIEYFDAEDFNRIFAKLLKEN